MPYIPVELRDLLNVADTVVPTEGFTIVGDGTDWVLAELAAGDVLHTANISGAYTVDLANGTFQQLTATGDATLSLDGAEPGKVSSVTVQLRQDGTGGHDITWPLVSWLPGVPPSENQVADTSTLVTFWSIDGGTTWYGTYSLGVSPGYSETIGDGSATTIAVTHSLGTTDLLVQVQDLEGAAPVMTIPDEIEFTDTDTVTLTFLVAPAVDGRRVNIKAIL